MSTIQLVLSDKYYSKDPQTTDLGQKIIRSSIKMLDELGFEQFTFKKLAKEIDSTEASIYRYFENKHRLLIYLIAWYWNWMEYRIDYSIQNVFDPKEKLKIALKTICSRKEADPLFPDIDEAALYRIVVAESDKTYLNKQVDDINKDGLFRGYKALCKRIAGFIKELNPNYSYSHSLSSTVLEAAHQQLFFCQHLPSLSDINSKDPDPNGQIYEFIQSTVFQTIRP
ncbi:MAG: TetR/AcrR family transcriptional regulator [Bacteroidota bacterium]